MFQLHALAGKSGRWNKAVIGLLICMAVWKPVWISHHRQGFPSASVHPWMLATCADTDTKKKIQLRLMAIVLARR
jgi:hypothetical protein